MHKREREREKKKRRKKGNQIVSNSQDYCFFINIWMINASYQQACGKEANRWAQSVWMELQRCCWDMQMDTQQESPRGWQSQARGGYLPLKVMPIYKKKKKSIFPPFFPFLLRANRCPADPLQGQRLAAELYPRRAGSNDSVTVTSSYFVRKPTKFNKTGEQGECMSWNG